MPQWRKTHRLKGYDYSLPGAYFMTICTGQREHSLGQISVDEIELTRLGQLVRETWLSQPDHFSGLFLDAWTIMPNHFHAVIGIADPAPGSAALRRATVPAVVQAFKAHTTLIARKQGLLRRAGSLWQDDYYDHIVRNDFSLQRIREYIANNLLQWHLDVENGERTGTNIFYDWLEAEAGKSSPRD